MTLNETCPHCGNKNEFKDVKQDYWILPCSKCGKMIPLCGKCEASHPDADSLPCSDCIMCDCANFMNYLRGTVKIEDFLSSLNPPLTDMTTGMEEGVIPTLQDYLEDKYGDEVSWDVKYWDIYRLVSETFLNSESSQQDCLDFVSQIVDMNKK